MNIKKIISLITAIACMLSILCVMPAFSDSTYLSNKGSWRVEALSVLEPAENAIDGDPSTHWHSYVTWGDSGNFIPDPPPYNLDITLPVKTTISGFSILPRQNMVTGLPLEYEIYAKETDDGEWIKVIDGNDMGASSKDRRDKSFLGNIQVKQIRFSTTKTSENYVVITEFDLIAENPSLSLMTMEQHWELHDGDKETTVPKYEMTALGSEQNNTSTNSYLNATDGDYNTIWRSTQDSWLGGDGKYTLTIDLGRNYKFYAINYYLGDGSYTSETWDSVKISISDNNSSYTSVTTASLSDEIDTQTIDLGDLCSARYVKFEITQNKTGGTISNYNRAACSELDFVTQKKYLKEVVYPEYEFTLGSPVLNISQSSGTTSNNLGVAPYIENGRTLIPLRGFFEEIGASVSWDQTNQTIRITRSNATTTLVTIEMQVMNKKVKITDWLSSKTYYFDVTPVIKDSRVFIPLRFVSEHLGYSVGWNEAEGEVTIGFEI